MPINLVYKSLFGFVHAFSLLAFAWKGAAGRGPLDPSIGPVLPLALLAARASHPRARFADVPRYVAPAKEHVARPHFA